MAAFVRVSGPPNGNYLIGYPGISATLVSLASFLCLSAHSTRAELELTRRMQ
jgi:hypothetical protein